MNQATQLDIAIVDDEAGVTRDRVYGEAEWNGRTIPIVDTGGYVPRSDDPFERAIREQAKIALEDADAILFVVDVTTGITDVDQEIAQVLARGNEDVKERLLRRGIDLDDFDTDALLDEAADVFQRTKTMGPEDLRGILKNVDAADLAEQRPQLFERIKRHGTDRLPRVMDEVAKDLAVQSPAVKAVVWTLSSRHGSLDSSPDECDFLASQDPHGLGPGRYKPTHVPSHPHPNCECSVTTVTWDSGWGDREVETPSAPDIDEDSVRAVLEDVAGRIEGGRTVTDIHVQNVMERINDVTREVRANPRG